MRWLYAPFAALAGSGGTWFLLDKHPELLTPVPCVAHDVDETVITVPAAPPSAKCPQVQECAQAQVEKAAELDAFAEAAQGLQRTTALLHDAVVYFLGVAPAAPAVWQAQLQELQGKAMAALPPVPPVAAEALFDAKKQLAEALKPARLFMKRELQQFLEQYPEHAAAMAGKDPLLVAFALIALLIFGLWEFFNLFLFIFVRPLRCCCRCCCGRRSAAAGPPAEAGADAAAEEAADAAARTAAVSDMSPADDAAGQRAQKTASAKKPNRNKIRK
eukprot:TRINITY_DN4247_c0_g2_i1.p1 TRINITY_DN4247_c0_g2~~TRINITY_DN4247_c0_g2_i1.p1  ORF type:complete len:274 (+),score=102.32 TRINITY_DN4247_c0_g2_i1:73-894(+)